MTMYTMYDYQFTQVLSELDKFLKASNMLAKGHWHWSELSEEYENLTKLSGSKIDGYPYFTQDDPRPYSTNTESEPFILLLQIDSDKEGKIYWGDCGVANFFIQPSRL